MAIVFNKGAYPYMTIFEDSTGCLHLFKGQKKLTNSNSCPKDFQGNEADTFIQFQSDIEAIKECLNEDEREFLSNGYVIQTKHISDEYITEN